MSGVRIERQGRLAVLRLDKSRGNAIDEPLAEDLARAAAEVASDAGVRGVLLASAHPKLFCPGLDLVALAGYDRPSMERFMTSFAVTVWALLRAAEAGRGRGQRRRRGRGAASSPSPRTTAC